VKFFADHAGIVDTQELVLGGGHVDEIRLAFGPFFVQELVYRLVSGCLAQVGRTPLGGNDQLGVAVLGQSRNMPDAVDVQIRCFVSLDLSDGTAAALLDEQRIHHRDTDAVPFTVSILWGRVGIESTN